MSDGGVGDKEDEDGSKETFKSQEGQTRGKTMSHEVLGRGPTEGLGVNE